MQIDAIHKKAQQLVNDGKYRQAHELCVQIIQRDSEHADAYFLLGIIAAETQKISKAIALIEKAIKFNSDESEYWAHLAKCYALRGEQEKVQELVARAEALPPLSALTIDTLGSALTRIGLYSESLRFFKQAVEKSPRHTHFLYNLGAALRILGDIDEARKCFERAIELDISCYKAHVALSGLGGISAENNHIQRLELLLNNELTVDDRLRLCHAIASEYQTLGEYSKVIEYLKLAKQKKLAVTQYSFVDDEVMFNELMEKFSDEHSFRRSQCKSDAALFVVGMPRTGTTLVERIISNHSDVVSFGELQNFGMLLKQLTKTQTKKLLDKETIQAAISVNFSVLGEKYLESTNIVNLKEKKFVDKMPLNILYVGFILQAMPNAKIICLDRHPLDTIISNFTQLFAVNYSYYNYAFALETTAQYFVLFKRLQQLWAKKYPNNFFVVDYQELVNQSESEARKILKHCDLEWEPQCVAIESNITPVATASAVQVREPIHNRSVNKWKNYENYLTEVKAILDSAGIAYSD
ncbi:tetratricopeptide repeat-containing sulfotransferase family protein [Pleionea sediminis]|uniref:tetratricopeptide repeat-containing sulfotransferase family protein n=1 Tax=Pleionea sediminis TaxID=2569479 RepID=UPI001185C502|nr:sulfotransferase [Pleionea sediminis]